MDTNVLNYTYSELWQIVQLDDPNDIDEILDKTNTLSRKFQVTNPTLSLFFRSVQKRLIYGAQHPEHYEDMYNEDVNNEDVNNEDANNENANNEDANNEDTYNEDANNEDTYNEDVNSADVNNDLVETYQNMNMSNNVNNQSTTWFQNQYLEQTNKTQTDKITNRQNTVQLFDNPQVPMKREQIATNDTYALPVKQDSLNPNLKNTITRFVNLDSQFRQYTNGTESISTDYTLDLSDTLKDALKLKLYSFQIPQSWYAIDTFYGNTCFWIVNNTSSVPILVPSGNYTQLAFKDQLIQSFTDIGFAFISDPVQYNINSGIISLHLFNGTFSGVIDSEQVNFTITEETIILFFDFTGVLHCTNNCFSKTQRYLNNTLGWIMGYKMPYINVLAAGNPAPAVLDLNGTKYLILALDDYNQNHVNNNVVSISQYSNVLRVPSYYSEDIPHTCVPAQQGSNIQQLIDGVKSTSRVDVQSTNPLNGLLIGGKYATNYTDVQQILPSAPRTLTNAQIYTINEIKKNRINNINYLSKAPTTADVLAILPVKTSVGVSTGSLLVEFSGSLQDNNRVYFGPVDIDRMSVKLLDDKGNILNLNGNDWCVTLICECLYQY
jgi:hypothetical protein